MAKSPKAQRAQRALDCKGSFESRALLSGAPLKSNVGELSAQLEVAGSVVDDVEKMSPGAAWSALLKLKTHLKKATKEELPHLQLKEPKLVDAPLLGQAQLKLEEAALEKAGKANEWALSALAEERPCWPGHCFH